MHYDYQAKDCRELQNHIKGNTILNVRLIDNSAYLHIKPRNNRICTESIIKCHISVWNYWTDHKPYKDYYARQVVYKHL